MSEFHQFYKGKRVLVTGAHGFKGGWLSLWLSKLGADVYGAGLDRKSSATCFESCFAQLITLDVTDQERVVEFIEKIQPDIVFHLAAEALVCSGLENPSGMLRANVLGTTHVLAACSKLANPPRVVVVTSDKCYWPTDEDAVESDRLGGRDPYSVSKACAELVCECWRHCYMLDVRTVRAGNVIGGGDLSKNRLVPDYIEAVRSGTPLKIRNSLAIRPWQHVLDCLSGYLMAGMASYWPDAVNFGPEANGHSVAQVLELMDNYFKRPVIQSGNEALASKESSVLHLNIDLAKSLGWRPLLPLKDAVTLTARWYHCWMYGPQEMSTVSSAQIDDYMEMASKEGVGWAVDGAKWLSDMTP